MRISQPQMGGWTVAILTGLTWAAAGCGPPTVDEMIAKIEKKKEPSDEEMAPLQEALGSPATSSFDRTKVFKALAKACADRDCLVDITVRFLEIEEKEEGRLLFCFENLAPNWYRMASADPAPEELNVNRFSDLLHDDGKGEEVALFLAKYTDDRIRTTSRFFEVMFDEDSRPAAIAGMAELGDLGNWAKTDSGKNALSYVQEKLADADDVFVALMLEEFLAASGWTEEEEGDDDDAEEVEPNAAILEMAGITIEQLVAKAKPEVFTEKGAGRAVELLLFAANGDEAVQKRAAKHLALMLGGLTDAVLEPTLYALAPGLGAKNPVALGGLVTVFRSAEEKDKKVASKALKFLKKSAGAPVIEALLSDPPVPPAQANLLVGHLKKLKRPYNGTALLTLTDAGGKALGKVETAICRRVVPVAAPPEAATAGKGKKKKKKKGKKAAPPQPKMGGCLKAVRSGKKDGVAKFKKVDAGLWFVVVRHPAGTWMTEAAASGSGKGAAKAAPKDDAKDGAKKDGKKDAKASTDGGKGAGGELVSAWRCELRPKKTCKVTVVVKK